MTTPTQSMVRQPLAQIVTTLPPDIQDEVQDFIEFLMEKRLRKPKRKPTLNWRGALSHLRDEYTSVQLQHKALEWREE